MSKKYLSNLIGIARDRKQLVASLAEEDIEVFEKAHGL
jgi:hypothetical protein